MNDSEEPLPKISRLEICMLMQGNSHDFKDQSEQQNAVLHFILQKLSLTINEVNQTSLDSLKKSVQIFVSNLISKYKGHNKHIARLVQEESMLKGLPDSLKVSIDLLIKTIAPYSRVTQKNFC